jgi:hypothetical protein
MRRREAVASSDPGAAAAGKLPENSGRHEGTNSAES